MTVLAGQKALADEINAALATCIGGEVRGSDTAAINTTETVWATTGTTALSLEASSTYEVRFRAGFSVSDATGQFLFIVRDTDVTGLVRLQAVASNPIASTPFEFGGAFLFTTTTATTKKWVVSVDRIGGSGNVIVSGGSNLRVTYIAPSGTIATI